MSCRDGVLMINISISFRHTTRSCRLTEDSLAILIFSRRPKYPKSVDQSSDHHFSCLTPSARDNGHTNDGLIVIVPNVSDDLVQQVRLPHQYLMDQDLSSCSV